MAELYMRKFDSIVQSINSVYYYARYVDDIIIFTLCDPKKTISIVKSNLPYGLALNPKKFRTTYVPCKKLYYPPGEMCIKESYKRCTHKEKGIEFLGYKLNFDCSIIDRRKITKPKDVQVSIASNKVKKIKTRITRAFIDYTKNKDFELLEQRIKFLTGNFKLHSKTRDSFIMSGIYYNYPLLSDPKKEMDKLDFFLKNIIFGKKNIFWGRLTLTKKQKRYLAKFTFSTGYTKRITHKFTQQEICKIKECWQNG
jgi:hypothetical protein